MSYIAGNPKALGTRQVWEGAAVAGQRSIVIPGGFTPGSCDVFVGGANLLSSDYVDSDGGQILLNSGMAAGTAYRVVLMPRFSGIVQNTPRLITDGAATAGQTIIPIPGGFMGGAGMTDVFVNGIALTAGADYDDTSGTQIVLTKGMNAGMQFRVASYAPGVSVQPVGGQLAGFRNRIINGACTINQRGTLSSANPFGGPDRYWMQVSGAGGAFNQSQGTITFGGVVKQAVVQTVTTPVADLSASKYWSGITQWIEGFNAYDLIGKPLAVSFIFQASISGNYSINLRDGTDANSYVTTFNAVAGVPQKVTVIVPPIPSNAGIPNSNSRGLVIWIGAQNGATLVMPPAQLGQWVNGLYLTANNIVTWGLTSGATIAVAELQVEPGTVATPFENRPYGLELSLCQRYFAKTYGVGLLPGSVNSVGQVGILGMSTGAASYWGVNWKFPVSMRATPSVTVYSPSTGAAGVMQLVGTGDIGAVAINISDSASMILINNGNVYTPGSGNPAYAQAIAVAEVP
jgi:hypothetical protein